MSYTNQLQALRDCAIKDIRAYIEDCGETVIKRGSRACMVHVEHDQLYISGDLAENTDTPTLLITADMFNAMP